MQHFHFHLLGISTLLIPCFLTASIPLNDFDKPTVVLVPDAWHVPEHFAELIGNLARAGFPAVSQRNPSCGSVSPDSQSTAIDAAFIRDQILLPLINAGKTVVLAMHSYGGSPGAAAAKGLSKAERNAAGQPGGIIGLIFICAVLAHEGQSLLSLLPGQEFDPWVIQYWDGQLGVSNPKDVFYGEVSDTLSREAIHLLRLQSRASLSTPSGPPAWSDPVFNERRAYFVSTNDHSIPAVTQEGMLGGTGVLWDIKRYPSDHCPFLSHPDVLGAWMIGLISSWQGGCKGGLLPSLAESNDGLFPVLPASQ